MLYRIAADAILILHTLFVAFVLFGLLLVFIGAAIHWQWIRNWWFRAIHLAAIGIVVVQSWLGRICPLTIWELQLRVRAGEGVYTDTFIAYWLQRILFYQAPPWVFIAAYTLFGCLTIASWYWVRPQKKLDSGTG